jgi:CubicO group peptidase (beta-lactamase class C family)
LLSHTSGLPDIDDYGWENPQYDNGALTRYVLSLNETKLLYNPGEKWSFSSLAYDVLGDIIAKATHMTFEDYMKKYVLDPLDMRYSTFYKGKAKKVLCTAPHVRKLTPVISEIYPYNRAHAPSSTLHSNVKEMCNYAIANLNRGMFGDDRLLKAISYNTMWSPVCDATEGKKMGLSWFVCEREGELVVTHSGGDLGFQANFCLIPKRMASVIVLSNYDLTPAAKISLGLWDIIEGKEPVLPKIPVMIPLGRFLVHGTANQMIQHYNDIQSTQSELYIFNEAQLDVLGSDLLELVRIEEAIEILKLNARIYPESSKVYDSLAGAYMIAGDNQLAIENYTKSLEINPENANARQMIKKIREERSHDI